MASSGSSTELALAAAHAARPDAAARARARSPSSGPPTGPAPTAATSCATSPRRLRGARSGASTRSATGSSAARCVPSVADLPEPVDAVVVAIPAAGRRAAVLAEAASAAAAAPSSSPPASARSSRAAALERELSEARARAHGLPVCGPNGNGDRRRRRRAPLWGDSVEPTPSRARSAMVTQSGNVAVNALGSRRGIGLHTVVSTGNQAVCDASDWLAAARRSATGCARSRSSSSPTATARGSPRRWRAAPSAASASPCSRSAPRRPARAPPPRTPARWPATSASSAPWSRRPARAWAADPHELLELARALAEPRARPRGSRRARRPHLLRRRLGGRRRPGRALGLELPPLAPETPERLAELLPERRRSPTRSTTRR